MEIPRDLPVVAYTKREDPRDALILKAGKISLKQGGVIGSSSRRRSLQAAKLYPRCVFKNIRGNVQTRLFKLEHEDYDATILALAGLKRLGMEGCVSRPQARGFWLSRGERGRRFRGLRHWMMIRAG